jgi:4a-hydroxytetrahydrobiopterin dehydratase
MKLAEQSCVPIKTGEPPLSSRKIDELLREVPNWSLGDKTIVREFRFKDFRQAMDFVNKAAAVANEQDHHPDIFISYNKVQITFTTHKINGLSLNDFISAAKIDNLTGQPTA